jgi:hypothetical protein
VNLVIEINGLDPIINKLGKWGSHVRQAMDRTALAALHVVWESVPPYPEQSPDSTYRRTGTLGRSLGVGMGGAQQGQADIFEVKSGPGFVSASFGTRLEYARYVIGDAGSEQAWMHRGWWWTLPQAVWSRAKPKVIQLFHNTAEEIIRWFKGL